MISSLQKKARKKVCFSAQNNEKYFVFNGYLRHNKTNPSKFTKYCAELVHRNIIINNESGSFCAVQKNAVSGIVLLRF